MWITAAKKPGLRTKAGVWRRWKDTGRRPMAGSRVGTHGSAGDPIRKIRLSTEITVLLCAKLLALVAIYYLFFAPATHPPVDANAISARLLNSNSHP